MPSYLGPSVWAMSHLLVLLILNNISLFALSVLLIRSTYSLATNTTMIESWEIERHEVLVERARENGGYLYASNGKEMRLEHQEFPYDIGFWRNICQGMGTGNIVMWFMPFAATPSMDSAINYETNGFEDTDKEWPPPDPDKMPRHPVSHASTRPQESWNTEAGMAAFRKRQSEDLRKHYIKSGSVEEDDLDEYASDVEQGMDGEAGWTNSEGDRLKDYGVDEEAEGFADEDIPLAELLRRRNARHFG